MYYKRTMMRQRHIGMKDTIKEIMYVFVKKYFKKLIVTECINDVSLLFWMSKKYVENTHVGDFVKSNFIFESIPQKMT